MGFRLFLLIMVIVSNISLGQKNNRVGVKYSYLDSCFLEHAEEEYVVYSYDFTVNRVGVFYNRKIYKWFRFETGFDFILSNYTTKFQGTPDFIEDDDSLYMVSLPMILSIEFLKYFYFKAGILVDFQTNVSKFSDEQSGIGGTSGYGIKYDYQDYTFSIGVQALERRMKSFTKLDVFPNYLHHYGVTANFGYSF